VNQTEQLMFNDNQLEQLEAISDLADICASLPKQDNIFAGKMIRAFDYYGKLTDKQMAVVQDILKRNAA
jgi:hypothetical protein